MQQGSIYSIQSGAMLLQGNSLRLALACGTAMAPSIVYNAACSADLRCLRAYAPANSGLVVLNRTSV